MGIQTYVNAPLVAQCVLQFRLCPQTPLVQPRVPVVDVSLHTSSIDLKRGASTVLAVRSPVLRGLQTRPCSELVRLTNLGPSSEMFLAPSRRMHVAVSASRTRLRMRRQHSCRSQRISLEVGQCVGPTGDGHDAGLARSHDSDLRPSEGRGRGGNGSFRVRAERNETTPSHNCIRMIAMRAVTTYFQVHVRRLPARRRRGQRAALDRSQRQSRRGTGP